MLGTCSKRTLPIRSCQWFDVYRVSCRRVDVQHDIDLNPSPKPQHSSLTSFLHKEYCIRGILTLLPSVRPTFRAKAESISTHPSRELVLCDPGNDPGPWDCRGCLLLGMPVHPAKACRVTVAGPVTPPCWVWGALTRHESSTTTF